MKLQGNRCFLNRHSPISTQIQFSGSLKSTNSKTQTSCHHSITFANKTWTRWPRYLISSWKCETSWRRPQSINFFYFSLLEVSKSMQSTNTSAGKSNLVRFQRARCKAEEWNANRIGFNAAPPTTWSLFAVARLLSRRWVAGANTTKALDDCLLLTETTPSLCSEGTCISSVCFRWARFSATISNVLTIPGNFVMFADCIDDRVMPISNVCWENLCQTVFRALWSTASNQAENKKFLCN